MAPWVDYHGATVAPPHATAAPLPEPTPPDPVSALHISLKLATRMLEAAIALVVISYLLLAVGLLTLRYAVLPNAQAFIPWMEQAGTRALGLPVHIGGVQSQWNGILPTLTLRNLVIDNPQGKPALRFDAVEAMPSWKSLPRLQLSFEQLVIRGAKLRIDRPDPTHLDIGGIRFDLNATSNGAGQRFVDWLFKQDQILIQHSQITWTDDTRGTPPLELRDVNVELRNTLLSHRAAFTAIPPAQIAAPFAIRADFRQPLLLRHTADFSRWHGTLWADWSRVDLSQIAQYAPVPVQVQGGTGGLQAWVNVGQRYKLEQVTADLSLRNAQAQLDPALPPLALTEVRGRIRGAPLPGGLELALNGLQFTMADGQHFPAVDARLRLQHPAGEGASGSLSTGPLNLTALSAAAQHIPLPPIWRTRLKQLQPTGRIDQLRASWQSPRGNQANGPPSIYSLKTSFTGLGWHSPAAALVASGAAAARPNPPAMTPEAPSLPLDLPGLQNLSGTVQADQTGGQAQLTIQDGSIALPHVFDAPSFAVQRLSSRLNWTRQKDGQWNLKTSRLQLETPDAAGSAALSYTTQAQGPGILDLTAQLTRADARAVPAYLPRGIPEATRDFLRTAIAGGRSSDVRFVVRGPLANFPFDKSGSKGTFSVKARIEDGVFNAAPLHILPKGEHANAGTVHTNAVWPEFTHINGLLDFTSRGMHVQGASAHVLGAQLQSVNLNLPNFAKPVLSATGQVRAQADDALRYLRESPLDAMLDHALSKVQASGPLQLDLAIHLPISNLKLSTVKGQLDLLGNRVDYMPSLPPFDGVRGGVDFSNTGFHLQITAQNWLGGPLQLSGGQAGGKPLALNASGTVNAQDLQSAPRLTQWADLLRHLQGKARYTATIGMVSTPQGAQPQVQLQSSLIGMAIVLPPPLGKPAIATDTLNFSQTFESGNSGPAQSIWRIDLGGDLHARFVRLLTQQGDVLQSGGIALGPQAVLPQPTQGVQASVVLPVLDIDAWQRALGGSNSARVAVSGQISATDLSGYLPQVLSLRVGSLTVSDRIFDDVVLGATRSNSLWQANLESKQLAGYVAWQMGQGDAPGSVTARLSRLSLPKNADPDVERLLEQQPRSMPALNVVADNVDLHGHSFSRLEVQATNRDRGGVKEWRLDRFALDSPDANLTGSGDWVATGAQAARADGPAPHRTSIGFKLAIHNAGALLARLGKPGLLKNGKGSMQGTVSWIGSPLSPDYPTMSGQFSLDLGNGQFLKADPGIAKLLGVLSLQSLPRRLLFNFSDLFESGFAFDKVNADVQMQDGLATTHNFKMGGISATVFIDGEANLAQETQNLYVVVVPEINAGSASLAYALINPAVGLGTFLAQLIARKPLMKAFTYGYRVTGTWAKPDVREVDGDKDARNGASVPSAQTKNRAANRPALPAAP